MKIIVCLKQVPDADAPRSSYSINARENRPELSGVPPVISYYDELALEAALRVRDANGADVHITALTLGKRISKPAMQLALAAGADELVKIEDPLFHEGVMDCHAKARLLTEAVRRIGPFDLVLVGRQSSDWNSGQTGFVMAALLKIPIVTLAKAIDIDGAKLRVTRILRHGHELVELSPPAVVMVAGKVGALRYPGVTGRRDASHKPVLAWSSREVGRPVPEERKVLTAAVALAAVPQRQCQFITGATTAEAGAQLAQVLTEQKVL